MAKKVPATKAKVKKAEAKKAPTKSSGIVESTRRYETWLRAQLGADLVEKDLEAKHEKMRQNAFSFFRATYYRWAEVVPKLCPVLVEGPRVLAVGDIHLENFGVWRDADGRLVWGVNDYDEAAKMPYALDLARLAVSAVLAPGPAQADIDKLCGMIVDGYEAGLEKPSAFVLDRDNTWLSEQFRVDAGERAAFWTKIQRQLEKARDKPVKPPPPYVAVLDAAMPAPIRKLTYWHRGAGTGSLGRPRWVAYGMWQDGPVLREAKAALPSAWSLANRDTKQRIRIQEAAQGRYRAPDPFYRVSSVRGAKNHILARRLSPNSRKLETEQHGAVLLDPRMLQAMGRDLAAIHLGTPPGATLADALRGSCDTLSRALPEAVRTAAKHFREEYTAWRYGAAA